MVQSLLLWQVGSNIWQPDSNTSLSKGSLLSGYIGVLCALCGARAAGKERCDCPVCVERYGVPLTGGE